MTHFTYKLLAMTFAMILFAGMAKADNWLTALPDNVYVRSLSIPGTHDSATGDGSLSIIGKTQELSLGQQWDCGVRVFDLRPTVKKDGDSHVLHIYHGMLSTKTSFTDAITLLRDKLKANPGEFAIVLMRHESDANSSVQYMWPQLMGEFLGSAEWADCLVEFKKDMTLGEVRGKLLVMSRDEYEGGPVGGYIRNWSHSYNFTEQKNTTFNCLGAEWERAIVQDFYECTNGTIDKKKAAITRLLDESARLNGSRWIVNHASGYTSSPFSSGIQDCAAQTNKLIADYLADESHSGSTGIVMMDYAGVDKSGSYDVMGLALTQAIIRQNSRYNHLSTGVGAMSGATDAVNVSGRVVTCDGPVVVMSACGTVVASGSGRVVIPSGGIYIVRACGSVVKVFVA